MGESRVCDIDESKSEDKKISTVDVLERALELIQFSKNKMKILYQLCFIATSDAPEKEEAERMIQQMIDLRLVTIPQVEKAMEDVKRWRRIFLDRLTQT